VPSVIQLRADLLTPAAIGGDVLRATRRALDLDARAAIYWTASYRRKSVNPILKRRCAVAGLDSDNYSVHGLGVLATTKAAR
jgi:hypothetical protein